MEVKIVTVKITHSYGVTGRHLPIYFKYCFTPAAVRRNNGERHVSNKKKSFFLFEC